MSRPWLMKMHSGCRKCTFGKLFYLIGTRNTERPLKQPGEPSRTNQCRLSPVDTGPRINTRNCGERIRQNRSHLWLHRCTALLCFKQTQAHTSAVLKFNHIGMRNAERKPQPNALYIASPFPECYDNCASLNIYRSSLAEDRFYFTLR